MTSNEATTPRVAFLIVAHNNPELFARLVGRLQAPWARVFALIDAKADQHRFAQAAADHPVIFLSAASRIDVQWGGIGLTTAALALMREAVRQFSPDRLVLLSGVDYPLRSMGEIGRGLNGDAQFVRVDRALDGRRSGNHDDFVRYFHFHDVPWLNPRSSPAPRLQRLATRMLRVLPRKPLAGHQLFHGCGWWSITGAAAAWVLRRLDEHPELFDWLRHANCPDEIMFQTMLKASPYASAISHDCTVLDVPPDDTVHGCHYIDWSQHDASSPKTLDLTDLPRLQRSSALFARKMDPVRSATLLAALDEQVAHRPHAS